MLIDVCSHLGKFSPKRSLSEAGFDRDRNNNEDHHTVEPHDHVGDVKPHCLEQPIPLTLKRRVVTNIALPASMKDSLSTSGFAVNSSHPTLHNRT